MSDPLSDPRANDLLGADLGEIEGVFHIFNTVATQANDAVTVMQKVSSTPTWTGQAADAAKSSMSKLAPQLQTIAQGYQDGAQALSEYYNAVADVQPQFKSLKTQLESAAASVSSLTSTYQSQASTYQGDTNFSLTAPLAKVFSTPAAAKAHAATVKQDQANMDATQTQLHNAQGTLSSLQAQGMRLLQNFSDSRDTVTSKVKTAYSHAPQESGWHHFLGGVEHVMGDVGGFFVGAAKTFGKDLVALPGDVATVATHPGDAKDWEKFGEDAVVVVGTVAVVASAVVTGGTALGAEGAVFETIEGGADMLETASTVTQLGNAGTEVAGGNIKGAAIDAAFAELPKTSDDIGIGGKMQEATKASAAGAGDYATALAKDGATPASAYAGLSDEARNGLDSTGVVPVNTKAADSLAASTKSAAATARRNHNLYGRPLDTTVDKTVNEPTKDKLHEDTHSVEIPDDGE
jgi:uncharacterized protein YukE